MKKVYLFIAFVFLGSMMAEAQFMRPVNVKSKLGTKQATPSRAKAGPSGNNQINSILWSDDFSNPANWILTHTSGVADWVIGTNPPSGPNPIDPINSTSSVNNFALFDSDALCDTAQVADLTNATPINCAGHPNLRLMFQQYYRKFVDSTFVLVSNDGSSWTRYSVNNTLGLFQFNDMHLSHNPANVTLDISSVAGNQDSVWIRFEFYSPSTLGPNAGCGYAWMVDDIFIVDIDSIDARVAPAFAGEYTEIPIIQTESVLLQGKIINNGLMPITGARLVYDLFDAQFNGIYSDSSVASGTIAPGDTSGFLDAVTAPYIISDTGVYFIQQTVVMPGDTSTYNDTDIGIIYVNDSSYARDYTAIDGDISNAYGFPAATFPNGGYFGQIYQIHHASQATSVTFLIANPTVGAQIRVAIYDATSGTPQAVPMATSANYTITPNDTLLFDFMTLPFQSPANVTPGNYLVAIQQVDTNFISLVGSTDIITPNKKYFKSASPNWSPLTLDISFILRLNNPSATLVGIKDVEESSLVYVYPNPTDGVINIVAADEKNVTINILNPLGQIIKTEFHETLHHQQIDLSGLPAGMYTVNIVTDKSEINKSVILK